MGKQRKKPPTEFRVLVGMNYPGEDGEEIRVEANDKITDPDPEWAEVQCNKGIIEPWVARQTENVFDERPEGLEVRGVKSRHANDGQDIVLTEVRD